MKIKYFQRKAVGGLLCGMVVLVSQTAARADNVELYVDTNTKQVFTEPGAGRVKLGTTVSTPSAIATPATVAAKPGEPAKNAPVVSGIGNLTLDGLVQVWAVNDPTTVFGANKDAESTLRLRRAELRTSGDIIPELGFTAMIDVAKQIKLDSKATETGELTGVSVNQSTNVLQDLNVQMRLAKMIPALNDIAPKLEFVAGQQKTPVTEEGYRSSSKIDMVERSIIGRTFGDQRDIGLVLKDTHDYFEYVGGFFNGSGRNTSDDNNDKNFAGHFVVKPINELKLGVFGQNGSTGHDEDAQDRWGLDSQVDVDIFSVKGEYAHGKDKEKKSEGFYVQPGVSLCEQLQLIARYDNFDPDTDADDDTIEEIAGALNWRLAKNNAQIQLEYLRRNNDATEDENVVLLNFQAAY